VRESDFRQRVRSPIDPASGYVASNAQLHLFAAKTGGAFPASLAQATAACCMLYRKLTVAIAS
jgi:hypothetical protein